MPDSTAPITILIVDDHEVVRIGLHALLKRAGDLQIVGEAGTGREALEAVRRLAPAVVLLDLRLPDIDGIEVCREILAIAPACKVLLLTSHVSEEAAVATLLAGAHGFLLKEVLGDELLRAIRQVAAGQSVLDPAITAKVLTLLKSPGHSTAQPPHHPLSPQEQHIMTLIIEGKTNKEIGAALELSEKTVRNTLTTVFRKLGVTRRAQAAATYSKQYSL